MNVKLYVEGGGGERAIHDSECRAGFRRFLEAAGLEGKMPRIVACGGRDDAFNNFRIAMRTRRANELPLLLVDSEVAVVPGADAWMHLQNRDGWARPVGATDDQAFLMVQCMETWLVADRKALREFFGDGWRENALPAWPRLEDVAKPAVFDALDAATAGCERKYYAKGKLSYDLLARVSPAKVVVACPHAGRLIERLKAL